MNVLAKIVIPKTNVTMGYINNELEEYAREEFFRLKKVLEIKRKMYGGIQENKKVKDRDVHEDIPICETCMNDIEEQVAMSKDKGLTIESEEEREPKMEEDKSLKLQEIEKLIRQITEIVDVTKEMDDKGLVDVSVEDFIKTAQELKGKLGEKSDLKEVTKSPTGDSSIQEDVDSSVLCDTCREEYDKEQKEKQTDKISTGIQPSLLSDGSRETVQFKQSRSPSISSEKDSDSELGTFETEYKEITKIIKTKNKDGSITIKKKVIKVEKETKAPVRNKSLPSSSRASSNNKSNMTYQSSKTSSKSNPYSGSRTVGLVAIKAMSETNMMTQNKMQRKVKSEILTFLPMSDPVERLCISSITLLSTDLDFDFTRSDDEDKDRIKFSYNIGEEFLSN